MGWIYRKVAHLRDTIINEMPYHNLIETSQYWYTGWSPGGGTVYEYEDTITSLFGYIREDLIDKIVYLRWNSDYDTIDHILYKFDLAVGDTLPDEIFDFPDVVNYVVSIDSFLINDVYRKS